MRASRVFLWTCLAALALGCPSPAPVESDPEYLAEIQKHRTAREERLRSEEGWLSLVGLYWLAVGENRFGADPSNDLVLSEDSAPAHAGSLHYDGQTVRAVAASGVEITVDGVPIGERELTSASPDVLRLGRLRLYIIERSGRHGVRVKDPESPARTGFTGLEYFPTDLRYRFRGKFKRFAEPREMAIPTVLGTPTPMLAPGLVEFDLDGETHTLLPLVSDPDDTEFFFIFKDLTSGHETYAAGRYLYGDLEGEEVAVDFNRTYNPPCVFTPFATCPLPPPENRMAVRVEAGEKVYGNH